MPTSSTRKSIKKVIRKLRRIQANSGRINYWFFRYSLMWIKNRANTLLDQRTNGYNSSIARQWTIDYFDTFALLKNDDPNSAAIEFGIGVKGQTEVNSKVNSDIKMVALENGYQYNVPSEFKSDDGSWTFKLPDGKYITISGYAGKSFLYDSLMEYYARGLYNSLYQKAFDKVMRGICK